MRMVYCLRPNIGEYIMLGMRMVYCSRPNIGEYIMHHEEWFIVY